jgi:hypothetical protein
VVDGFDVVAVWVADEHAVVTGVILGPHSRFVQHLGTGRDGGISECVYRLA